jgi:hypothetical protein
VRTSASTAEFYVNQATIPLGIAVFSCECGATQVQYGVEVPSGWLAAAGGSDRCPRCAGSKRPDDRPADLEEPHGSAPAR